MFFGNIQEDEVDFSNLRDEQHSIVRLRLNDRISESVE